MSSAAHATVLRIAANHPSLPGHFPGQPIVPGVVLLDCVLQEAERWLQRPVRPLALPNAKFIAPLLPDQSAELQLKLDAEELRVHGRVATARPSRKDCFESLGAGAA